MFYQVTKHTDAEITQFLQNMAERGCFLKKVIGNNFLFEKRPYDGNRVCALTLYSHGRESSTELQVREELVYLRSRGWNSICVGRPETLNDSRRHVYLVEEVKGSQIPVSDDRSEARARIRGKLKTFSNILLCLIYLGAASFLFSNSLIKVVTSNAYIFASLLMASFLGLCSVISVLAFLNKEKFLDLATLLLSFFLVLFAIFLFMDSILTDNGVSERIKIGSSSYKIYSDELPLSLKDLGADVSGSYRTSRKQESSSFLASYTYCFDESFGVEQGKTVYDQSSSKEVSYIRYTIFESRIPIIRNAVANQLNTGTAVKSEELAEQTGCEYAFKSSDGSFIICKEDRVLCVKAGFELEKFALRKLGSLI